MTRAIHDAGTDNAGAVDAGAEERARVTGALPRRRDLFHGGAWHVPRGGYAPTISPGTGEPLGEVAQADADDVADACEAAHAGFLEWRRTAPATRTALLRKLANVLRDHAESFALIDAANCGNPVAPMLKDAHDGALYLDFFAGLTTEVKGTVTPMGEGVVNMTVREPLGVCARILAYNHPILFLAIKIGAPIAAGNSVIVKPSPQAPLSALRFFELAGDILPPGVLNLVTGGRTAGAALAEHPRVRSVSLVGSVASGVAAARAAADTLKHVSLELGGKNALIVYPDADIPRAVAGAVGGMNFLWAGQSCGSTSRVFVHDDVYDEVVAGIVAGVACHRPGLPTEADTTMGALISAGHRDAVLTHIASARAEGARLVAGGGVPDDPRLAGGFYVEPTVFVDVEPAMRVAREEVFGPVMSILRWSDEEALFAAVNSVDYGLTSSIWTTGLANAHRAAARIEAGYIWVNGAGPHFMGTPFGGTKMSGIGREESIDELFSFTQSKNIHMKL